MSIGIPVKLLHEAVGHIVTIELNSGEIYRGKLLAGEDNMNCQLTDITFTARNGHVSKLEQVYIRGSKVRFFIVPDMLRYSPMFEKKAAVEKGIIGGKSSILRAQASASTTATRGRGGDRGRGRPRPERTGGSDRSGERGMKSRF